MLLQYKTESIFHSVKITFISKKIPFCLQY